MKRIFQAILLLAILFPINASALIEIRGSGGLTFAEPVGLNSRLTSSSISSIFAIGRWAADGIIRFPGTPLGIGMRYDWQGIKVGSPGTGSGNEFEVSAVRTAALLSYRFIEKTGYLGLIGTYGLTHKPVVRLKESSVVSDYDSGKSFSSSIGFDGGVNAGSAMFGGEVGYQNYVINEISGPVSGQATFDMTFSGFYGMIHFGLRL
ncbi:MAG: hypothetical protein ABL958_09880 [Bdellovibrionia bacterium]